MSSTIQPHNLRAAAVWSRGGKAYEEISRGIADAIEHCVLRLDPQPDERVLDLSTGTGWTSRIVARRGANVIGADIAEELLEAARARAVADSLAIEYQLADAERMPFGRRHSTPSSRLSASCSPATRGGGIRTRARRASRRPYRADHLGARRRGVRHVPGDAGVHAGAARPRAALAVCLGPAGARPRVARRRIRSALRKRHVVLPRAQPARRRGTRSRPATDRRARWTRTSTTSSARSYGSDFIAFHAGFTNDLGICVPRDTTSRSARDDRT